MIPVLRKYRETVQLLMFSAMRMTLLQVQVLLVTSFIMQKKMPKKVINYLYYYSNKVELLKSDQNNYLSLLHDIHHSSRENSFSCNY